MGKLVSIALIYIVHADLLHVHTGMLVLHYLTIKCYMEKIVATNRDYQCAHIKLAHENNNLVLLLFIVREKNECACHI